MTSDYEEKLKEKEEEEEEEDYERYRARREEEETVKNSCGRCQRTVFECKYAKEAHGVEWCMVDLPCAYKVGDEDE